ncbi:uncharacterized protein SPAPADRAFT_48473 [Spathaspora passalidarum NRRL Y-27907]|uniref:ubiquitinyl hydrolase 1 n=1 Tax=Spathaspora passalidarum (strain NRRL Y-27907 / 11-Y1) TaxID=619300 RepID=G3AH54_SPAPN|nr:uncharacterized protein SPAPADRAFT_48473 [Spathaspora passalidarum NRRL Y-27907]EGW35484.1 hypothetical protein SPAPADRAFT_48473 [Spathaspora passalidarum NRRL Y-27907]
MTPSISTANPASSPKSATSSPTKPKSFQEAVAAYTGKKFLTKQEKKRKRKLQLQQIQKQQQEQKEDKVEEPPVKKQKASTTSSILSNIFSLYKRVPFGGTPTPPPAPATETDEDLGEDLSESPFTGFSEAETKSQEEDDEGVDEEEKDEEQSNAVSEIDDEDDEEEDDDFKQTTSEESSPVDSSSPSSEEAIDEEEDMERLKHDLKVDQLINTGDDEEEDEDEDEDEDEEEEEEDEDDESSESVPAVKSISTPPTSPEEETTEKSIQKQEIEYNDINQDPNDRGSNNSTRIYKNWRELAKRKPPVGLLNQGVTCYMNSAIQSLLHIPAVQHYLNDISQGKYNNVLKPRSVSHTLAELSRKMWGYDKRPVKYVNPRKIISRLDDINCMMSEWQQEDSHEYFMSLMSRLQEDSTPKGKKLQESIIYDIFGGLLHQRITCSKCNNVSETKQEFYDLSLGLNKRKSKGDPSSKYSIEKSIREFFSNELIKVDSNLKDSGYFCETCHSHTQANKVSVINRAPETLTIHLKRFKFNGNSSSKVKQSIRYSKYLDLDQYTEGDITAKYRLVSVIVHEGRSISSGHYVAHCLQPDGVTWCTYDDEYINRIEERVALSDPSAYVLVYTKLTPKSKKRKFEEANGTPVKKRRV